MASAFRTLFEDFVENFCEIYTDPDERRDYLLDVKAYFLAPVHKTCYLTWATMPR